MQNHRHPDFVPISWYTLIVTPAKAGGHLEISGWIPAQGRDDGHLLWRDQRRPLPNDQRTRTKLGEELDQHHMWLLAIENDNTLNA